MVAPLRASLRQSPDHWAEGARAPMEPDQSLRSSFPKEQTKSSWNRFRGRSAVAAANYNRSIPALVTDAVTSFTVLVRKETQLARAEMSEKLGELAVGLGLLVVGAVLLIPALVILLQSVVTALVNARIPAVWSSLIVGGATLAVGLILLAVGIVRLKASRPVPSKTIKQLQADAEVAKNGGMRNDHATRERVA
ncbi:MAG: phage holin family protein [Alphaproteobacteria bacterium]|nr:phage holin family protein [Alphaproteobacteria bacterium]